MIDPNGGAIVYDETSHTGLRWAVNASTRARAGSEAGSDFEGRYWRIRYRGQDDLCHRVIWRIANGAIPDGLQIDHIDGNGKNNVISNLRLVPCEVNQRNRRMINSNGTGATGVRYSRKSNGYEAFWNDLTGRKRTKFFSCEKHGRESARLMACSHREKAVAALNGDGAGYSTAHGQRRIYG